MSEINILIRTADKARKAEISVDEMQNCGSIIQAALDNWSLPKDISYSIVNVSKTPPQILDPASTLGRSGINAGDTLEIQPVLVAG